MLICWNEDFVWLQILVNTSTISLKKTKYALVWTSNNTTNGINVWYDAMCPCILFITFIFLIRWNHIKASKQALTCYFLWFYYYHYDVTLYQQQRSKHDGKYYIRFFYSQSLFLFPLVTFLPKSDSTVPKRIFPLSLFAEEEEEKASRQELYRVIWQG